MPLLPAFVLTAALCLPSSAAPTAPPAGVMVLTTGDGELQWAPGEEAVRVLNKEGGQDRTIPLPRSGKFAPGGAVRAILPERGEFFLAIEDFREDFGLHLEEKAKAVKPKAVIVRSILRLMDLDGKVLWKHETADRMAVGEAADAQSLRVSQKGAVAILLQDIDPYTKKGGGRPVLTVIGPKGRTSMSLEYTAWTKVSEFAISRDGRHLAVLGFGLVPAEGEMTHALGYYKTTGSPLWIQALAKEPRRRLLQVVDVDGWTCCVETQSGLFSAFGHTGAKRDISPDQAWTEFGIKP